MSVDLCPLNVISYVLYIWFSSWTIFIELTYFYRTIMRTETCVTWVVCSLCLITLSVCRPIKDDEREAFASDNEVFRKKIV